MLRENLLHHPSMETLQQMPKTSLFVHLLTPLALVAVGGCDLGGGLVPSTAGYNFDTSCRGNSELEACDSCCEGIGGDRAFIDGDTCGCGVSVTDTAVCDTTTTFSECSGCCEEAGFGSSSRFSEGSAGRVCTCSKTEPVGGGGGTDAGGTDSGTADTGTPGTPVGSGEWPLNVAATTWRFDTPGSGQPIDSTIRNTGSGFEFTYSAADASRYPAAPRSAAWVEATIDAPAAGTYSFAYRVAGDHGDSDSTLELRFLGTDTVTVADDESVAGSFERSGRATVTVEAGGRFGLRIGAGTDEGGASGSYQLSSFERL